MEGISTELRARFDAATWQRGEAYQRRGLVHDLERDEAGRPVAARVEGTRPQPYSVFIEWLDEHHAVGDCDCPMGVQCKHVVATLLAGAATTEAPGRSADPGRLHETEAWLERLRGLVDDPAEASGGPGQQLLYLLTPEPLEGPPGLRVELAVGVRGKRLDNGGYIAPRPFTLRRSHRAHPPKVLQPSDEELLRELTEAGMPCAGETDASAWRLTGAQAATLLAGMVATGRAHWESPTAAPLRPGNPRPGQLVWALRDDGRQRPELRLAEAANTETEPPGPAWVLPGQPPRYIQDGFCGALALPLPEAALRILEAGVWHPADSLEAAEQALRAALAEPAPGAGEADATAAAPPLPPAHTLNHRTVTAEPVPVLTLTALRVETVAISFSLSPGLELPAATLDFRYAEGPEAPALYGDLAERTEDPLQRVVDGTLYAAHRDFAQERALVDALRAWLAPLAEAHGLRRREPGKPPPPAASIPQYPERWHGARDTAGWHAFLGQGLASLRAQGWQVEVRPDFPLTVPREPEAWEASVTPSGEEGWFGLGLGVVLDGERIDLLPPLLEALRALPGNAQAGLADPSEASGSLPVPLPDGRVVAMPQERLQPLLHTLVELYDRQAPLDAQGRLPVGPTDAARLADLEAAGWPWHGPESLRRLATDLTRPLEPAAAPPGLAAELRDYQARGVTWMQRLAAAGFSGVLADDMGLGKTLQTLAHLLTERAAGRADRPCLVVTPTSVLWNWEAEAARFAPELGVVAHHGPERDSQRLEDADLVVTTYALLRRDAGALAAVPWHVVVLDEAQQIRNPRSQTARAARGLTARQRLALTGTPLENHLGDLWSLFHFLMPGFLGNATTFRRRFRRPVEEHGDTERARSLAAQVRPFLLRRRKDEVASDLPPRTEMVHRVTMGQAQRDLYESVRLSVHEQLRTVMAEKGLDGARIEVLDALLKLRQVCCDPRLLPEAESAPRRQAARRAAGSAKLDALLGLLDELLDEGRRVLVFSQFTRMLDRIATALAERGWTWRTLTGETRDRQREVEAFQRGEAPLMLLSLKAGGTGLNLTAADTVIHYDPWWNPAAEAQATDRAHRIGQQHPVFVYRLICAGTVEERIQRLQAEKAALAAGIQGDDRDDGHGAGWLSDEDVATLLAALDTE